MKSLASPLLVDHISRVVRRRAESVGLTVKFDDVPGPYTTGATMVFPYIKYPIAEVDLQKLYGSVIHECGHHWRPEVFKILERALNTGRLRESLKTIYNIIEDYVMERHVSALSTGDANALAVSTSIICDSHADKWEKEEFPERPPETTPDEFYAPIAVMHLHLQNRYVFDNLSITAVDRMFNTYPDEAKDLIDTLEAEGWGTKLRTLEDPQDVWDYSCDLHNRLIPEAEPDTEEARKGADGPIKPGDEDGEGEGGPAPIPAGEGFIVSWRDVDLSEHNKEGKSPSTGGGGVYGIDWDGYEDYSKPFIQNLSEIEVLKTKEIDAQSKSSSTNKNQVIPTDEDSRILSKKVRRYLQSQSRSRVDGDKYHGRLNKTALTRLLLPPIERGEWNKRVFFEHKRKLLKDTAASLLVDCSGSMRGPRYHNACKAASQLCLVFDRILNIPVEVLGFSTSKYHYEACLMYEFKLFSERNITEDKLYHRFSAISKSLRGNNDADAVAYSYASLKKRREERKIMIVFSDGTPTDSLAGHPDTNLKFITDIIDKDKDVELYGVGLDTDCVQRYYKNNRVINYHSEITPTLFEIIRTGAIKHGQI